jgi:HTH-type transcriptional regulator, sugar sensing transcriptional regulator
MQEDVLERLGLDRREAMVYLALLQIGKSSAIEVSRKAKKERTQTYRILESMVEKGIVSFVIENKTKKFKASSPDKLLHQLKEKEAALIEILPTLRKMSQLKEKEKSSVEIFQGTRGVKALINEILELKKDYYILSEDSRDPKFDFFLTHFMKSLERENIHERELIKKRGNIIKSKNTTLRFLPEEYPYQATTLIYGDMVGIIICSDPFLAIRINSKELANTYKSYFEIMWKVSKKE